MRPLSIIDLASFENAPPPKAEKSNFAFSFALMPKEEKNAINSVYAFCSYIDNIVDSDSSDDEKSIETKKKRLELWERTIIDIYEGKNSPPSLTPLAFAIKRFDIPRQYFLDLIDGVRRDLLQKRYKTFEELKEYCYGVASVVGLISVEIFGYKYEETRQYAINLGYALQLTNILRDVKADKDRGYIYLPQEDLDRFNYSAEELRAEIYNDNFVELMRFQVDRARDYYYKARSFLRSDERPYVLPAEIMDDIYFRILEKIELYNYDVFSKNVKVSNVHKFMLALKHWLSIKMFVSRIKKLK